MLFGIGSSDHHGRSSRIQHSIHQVGKMFAAHRQSPAAAGPLARQGVGMVDVLFGYATGRAVPMYRGRPCRRSSAWMLLMFLPELPWRDRGIDVFLNRVDVGAGSVGKVIFVRIILQALPETDRC